jgi:hypothetical protein
MPQGEEYPEETSVMILGTVESRSNEPVSGAMVTVDGVDVEAYTDASGHFRAPLPRVSIGDVITVRVTGTDILGFDMIHEIQGLRDTLRISLEGDGGGG